MSATQRQWLYVVDSEIPCAMGGNSPPWAKVTVASPVLCYQCSSYSSVLTGVPTLCTTATHTLALRHVHRLACITAGRIASQSHTAQARAPSHQCCTNGLFTGVGAGSGVQSQVGSAGLLGPSQVL
jgi:hypothetical protein